MIEEPSSEAEPSDLSSTWKRLGSKGALVRGGLVALGLATLVGIVLVRPVGPVAKDRVLHQLGSGVLPPVLPGLPAEQEFTPRANGLSGLGARLATYGGSTRCSMRATVTAPDNTIISSRVIACGQLRDNQLARVARFPPQANSKGARYVLQVSLLPGAKEAISLLAARPTAEVPSARVGRVDGRAAQVNPEYGGRPRGFRVLGTTLRRVVQYRPAWVTPSSVVGMVLILLLLLVALAAAPRRFSVVILLAFAFIKGVLWTNVLPPLQAPDEAAHYAYAQFMAEDRAIPRRGTSRQGRSAYSEELQRLNRILNRQAAPPGNRPDFGPGTTGPDEDRLASHASGRSGGDGPSAGYSPVYYAPASLLYLASPGPSYERVGVMRLWNVALGTLSVWLALLIGRQLFPRSEATALALAVAVALQPMFSQQMAAINNDALVIAGAFLCLLIATWLIDPRRRAWLPVFAGMALGVTLLGKPFGLAMGPVLAVAWVIGWFRGTERAWPTWPRAFLQAGFGLAITYGAWLATSAIFHYPPTSLSSKSAHGNPSLGDYLHILTRDNYASLKSTWVQRFWGDFSWLDVRLPEPVYHLLDWATLGVIVLAGVWLLHILVGTIASRVTGRHLDPERMSMIVLTGLCLLAVASALGLLHLIEYQSFARTGSADILQGRYGLMVLPAVLALPALLLRRLLPTVPTAITMTVIATGLVCLHVLSLAVLVDNFYL